MKTLSASGLIFGLNLVILANLHLTTATNEVSPASTETRVRRLAKQESPNQAKFINYGHQSSRSGGAWDTAARSLLMSELGGISSSSKRATSAVTKARAGAGKSASKSRSSQRGKTMARAPKFMSSSRRSKAMARAARNRSRSQRRNASHRAQLIKSDDSKTKSRASKMRAANFESFVAAEPTIGRYKREVWQSVARSAAGPECICPQLMSFEQPAEHPTHAPEPEPVIESPPHIQESQQQQQSQSEQLQPQQQQQQQQQLNSAKQQQIQLQSQSQSQLQQQQQMQQQQERVEEIEKVIVEEKQEEDIEEVEQPKKPEPAASSRSEDLLSGIIHGVEDATKKLFGSTDLSSKVETEPKSDSLSGIGKKVDKVVGVVGDVKEGLAEAAVETLDKTVGGTKDKVIEPKLDKVVDTVDKIKDVKLDLVKEVKEPKPTEKAQVRPYVYNDASYKDNKSPPAKYPFMTKPNKKPYGYHQYESPKVSNLPQKCRYQVRELQLIIDELLYLLEGFGQKFLVDESISYKSREQISRKLSKVRYSAEEARVAGNVVHLSALNESIRATGLELIKLASNNAVGRLEPRLLTFANRLRRSYALFRKSCGGIY